MQFVAEQTTLPKEALDQKLITTTKTEAQHDVNPK
jgi:hypothetical protein